MRRPLLFALVGAGTVIVLALAAGYLYFFSGLRSAPRPLSLASSSPGSAGASSDSVLAGTWTVSSGSVARYHVNEVFAGTTSNHEAVAETPDIAGSLSIQSTSGGHELSDLKVTARLISLHSIDTVAGYNVANRDRIVQRTLATSQYPDAVFATKNVQLPADLAAGTANLTIPGQLTIHGVTKTEQVTVRQIQVSGTNAGVVGQTTFNMTDFGIQPPALPITSVQPQVTLEFDLKLTKA